MFHSIPTGSNFRRYAEVNAQDGILCRFLRTTLSVAGREMLIGNDAIISTLKLQ